MEFLVPNGSNTRARTHWPADDEGVPSSMLQVSPVRAFSDNYIWLIRAPATSITPQPRLRRPGSIPRTRMPAPFLLAWPRTSTKREHPANGFSACSLCKGFVMQMQNATLPPSKPTEAQTAFQNPNNNGPFGPFSSCSHCKGALRLRRWLCTCSTIIWLLEANSASPMSSLKRITSHGRL